MMYKRMFELNGHLESVSELNKAIADLTGNPNPWFDGEDECWRAWVEYEGAKTYILAEEV